MEYSNLKIDEEKLARDIAERLQTRFPEDPRRLLDLASDAIRTMKDLGRGAVYQGLVRYGIELAEKDKAVREGGSSI